MRKLYSIYTLLFVLFFGFVAFAQPGAEDGGGNLGGGDPAPAPINSNLILLAILGLLFVVYTFRKNKNVI
jgi:hypothetical protein